MSAFEERLVKWSPRITLILSATVVVLAGVAVYILTQYQPKTACERNPQSRECQQIKVESDKARNVHSACVILHKAGYKCPVGDVRKRIEKREKGHDERPTTPGSSPDSSGGPATTQPPPDSGGDTGGGGSSGQPGPVGPTPAPPSPPTPPPTPSPPEPPSPPPAPPKPPSNPTLGDQVGGAAGDTIDHVTGIGCAVTNALGICIR